MSSDQLCQDVPAASEADLIPARQDIDRDLAISVRDVGKCYQIYSRPQDRLKQALLRWRGRQYYREFWALRHVWLDVRRGEAVGIIGRNGSGKSTLLQLIAGTVTPSEGEVRVNGRVAALLELGSGFNPEFTGRENVFLNGSILGISQSEMQGRFDQIASFADIGEFMDQPVKTYSSGMYVRLAFAVATSVEPDILIVDEALAVGDMLFQHKCVHRIRQMREVGATLLFVSHDPDTVRALCQRGLWLEGGCVKMLDQARIVTERYLETMRLAHNAQVLQQPAASQKEEAAPLQLEALDGGDLIRVERIVLLNEAGCPVDCLQQKERFTIEVVLSGIQDLDHVSVGVVIKDRLGIDLTGESVFNRFRHGFRVKPGKPVVARFSALNNLRDGQYSVEVLINRVSQWDRSDSIVLYSDPLALAFRVLADPDDPVWFRFRHEFEVSIT